MSELIDLLFGLWTRVSQRNHVLDCGLDPQGEGPVVGFSDLLKNIVIVKSARTAIHNIQYTYQQIACALSNI